MPPPTIDDGMGQGVFRLPLLGARYSLLVGAPSAEVDGAARAGLVSVLAAEPGLGVVLHPHYHSILIEGAASSHCPGSEHRFAWEHGSNRGFGRALSWYSENIGADFLDYSNDPVVGAPRAAGSNGMVAQYRGCASCGSFASSPGSVMLEGDDVDSDQFGSAVGAAASDAPQRALVVGVPGEDMGQGAVVILKLVIDPATDAFVASEPASIIHAAGAGLPTAIGAHWGEIIAPPRAFPTKPTEYP